MDSEADDLETRYFRAAAALDRGNVPLARREFDILVLDAPDFAPAWDGLGRCFDAEGELERAGQCFRKAIRVDHGNWSSRCRWAAALRRTGRLREAVRWLRAAARVAPGERQVHFELGQCLTESGEVDAAVVAYGLALKQPERETSDAAVYRAIGAAQAERGDLEAADSAYERACLLAPDDPGIYYDWAVLTARQGDIPNAERLANRARAMERGAVRSDHLLVQLAFGGSDWERAERRIGELEARPEGERLGLALRAELARRRGDSENARLLALQTLRHTGVPADQAVDTALGVLRQAREPAAGLQGFRLLLEVECGDHAYYRPYVVLAADEDAAQALVAELQDELDTCPWHVLETGSFDHEGEAVPGVYQLLLSRVMFARNRLFTADWT